MPVFDDGRKHKRQKRDAVDLLWLVEGRQVAGKGRLVDISMTGLCVEMSGSAFPVQAGLTVFIQIPDIPVAPKRARLRWYRRVAHRSSVYLCGLIFLPPYDQAWAEWVSEYIGEQEARASDSASFTVEDIVALMKNGGQLPATPPAPVKAPAKSRRVLGFVLKKK